MDSRHSSGSRNGGDTGVNANPIGGVYACQRSVVSDNVGVYTGGSPGSAGIWCGRLSTDEEFGARGWPVVFGCRFRVFSDIYACLWPIDRGSVGVCSCDIGYDGLSMYPPLAKSGDFGRTWKMGGRRYFGNRSGCGNASIVVRRAANKWRPVRV